MKTKMLLFFVAIALVTFGLYGTSYSYHDGGVARCEGCHTMHNSLNGTTMRTVGGMVQFQAGPYLLQGDEASTVCLNCHGTGTATSSYHVSTEGAVDSIGGQLPNQYTPGGDFSWIRTTTNSIGSNRGHSITSVAYGYVPDARMVTSPGGDYPALTLGCTGCHNPHGQYRRDSTGTYSTTGAPIDGSGSYGAVPAAGEAVGAYRLLGGVGYKSKFAGAATAFVNDPPTAVAPSSYNRTDTAAGGQTRVAYGAGMSEWCANCHGGIQLTTGYVSGGNHQRHPAGNIATLGATIAGNYNAYVSSGVMTGTSATSYNSLVPFEEQDTNYATLALKAGSSNAPLDGPSASSTVMCLSCHRAHATGFASMLRFDAADALVTDGAGVFEIRAGYTPAALQAAYYGRGDSTQNTSFGNAQRMLCNKCHAKD